jgi:hypothetical protein
VRVPILSSVLGQREVFVIIVTVNAVVQSEKNTKALGKNRICGFELNVIARDISGCGCMGSASRFDIAALVLSNDGRPGPPRSTPPCHAFFPILRHCQYLRQPRFLIPRFSAVLYSHAEQSQSTMLSPAKNAFPSLSDFSVLFLHTISLIHRHLALYHPQVAIYELESFASSPTYNI